MCLGGLQEGEMVATVCEGDTPMAHSVPQPEHGQVGAHDEWPEKHREVGEVLLHWVAIQCSHCHRGCPLMVDLVDVLVKIAMVEQSELKKNQIGFKKSVHINIIH